MSTMVARDAVGVRVRELREARGITQPNLAELLGVSVPTVSRVESGERGLTADELGLLAGRFGVPADFLLFGEREEALLLRAEGDAAGAVEFARGVVRDIEFVRALSG